MQQLYKAYCETVKGTRKFLPENQKLPPFSKDGYESLLRYTEESAKLAEKTGTVSSVKGEWAKRLLFDFDSKENIELARQDALITVNKLIENGTPQESIKTYFSGSKGFHVEVELETPITHKEFVDIVFGLAGNLTTFDKTINDENRIVRVVNTRHPESKLFKIPLELYELDEMNSEQIRKLGSSPRQFSLPKISIQIPQSLLKLKKLEIVKEIKPKVAMTLDLSNRNPQWKPWKWALLQGHFGDEPGERHIALTILAATCRGMGYDKELTYYLCKSALKKQAARTGRDEFDKEELWDNIIEKSVFGPNWKGGQYSPENNPWLQKYCDKLGIDWQKDVSEKITTIDETFDLFKGYAENIDGLTIKTGIEELDKKLRLTVGMSVGLVAAPGVGKTSMAIQMLNNMSKQGINSVFFSYDMYHSLVFQKLVQKHFGLPSEEIFNRFKNKDEKFIKEVKETISREYENVSFCFETGQTVEDIMNTIKEAEDKRQSPVKFIVMDYNELVITDKSDPTQSSSYVAQKMREIANAQQICVLSLFQPNKMAGSPADDLKSYRSAKGSSAIEQSVSVMLGMSRPGFNPRQPEEDVFASISCLKNRMGPIFSLDLGWDGLTGDLYNLDNEQRGFLREIRDRGKEEVSFV